MRTLLPIGIVRQTLAALACALAATGAHAVSSSVTVNDITFRVTDVAPGDGIAPAVIFDPIIPFYSESQERDVRASWNGFIGERRCNTCPVELGTVEIYKDDNFNLAARALAPGSLYLDQRIVENIVGVTPGTRVTVSVDVSFNDGLIAPIGSASLELAMVGYMLFPDHYDGTSATQHAVFTEPSHATIEASFTNDGPVVAPLFFAYIMEISGGPSPIPESDTALLMAVGLGFLAWRVRRP